MGVQKESGGDAEAVALGDLADHLDVNGPPLGRSGDVIEYEFVHAVFVVLLSHLHRIAEVDVALEFDALGCLSVTHVQADDQAFG